MIVIRTISASRGWCKLVSATLALVFSCLMVLPTWAQPAAAPPKATEPAAGQGATKTEDEATKEKRLKWWRDARFGLFIHWGLYAVPAGEWKGQQIAGIGEWIMNRAQIPVDEYAQLATQFNPVKFDADKIVKMAKDAGMKYIAITSKHHDGFAMFGSQASKYNIVDATPFKRDPLKELAAACQKEGIKLCFYYSQSQDWHEPDAMGNTWSFPDASKKDFTKYFEEKCKPQVKELLTNYGPIGLIWFDTPQQITKEQSAELVNLVHTLQPDCLVSGRVGHGLGDYDSAGDNQISMGNRKRDWETPVTLNDTWGYKKNDDHWKTPTVLIHQLALVAGRGGNYLLNVGPTAEGVVPQPSVDRLAEVGQWMKVNGESIYGTMGSPYPYDFSWGPITTKPNRVYLHVFDWPKEKLVLYGLKNKVSKAYCLADRNHELVVGQKSNAAIQHDELEIALPSVAPDKHDSVIALEIDGEARIDPTLTQQPDGSVKLSAHLGSPHKAANQDAGLSFDNRGVAARWTNKDEWLDWNFKVVKPGTFDVLLITSDKKGGGAWDSGHEVALEVAGQTIKGTVKDDGHEVNPSNPYWPYYISKLGRVTVSDPGTINTALKPQSIKTDKNTGLTLVEVRLVPIEK